jgi:hypothetical protein
VAASRDAEIDLIQFYRSRWKRICRLHKIQNQAPMLITWVPIRKSMRCPAFQKMAIAMLGHPFCPCQVALPRPSRTVGFLRRIDVQYDACDLGPIRALHLGIEEAQISHQMLQVIAGKHVSLGGLVGD